MGHTLSETIRTNSRMADQGLKIGDIVYSQYYDRIGRIARLSLNQYDPTNPMYVISQIDNPDNEILFGVCEHYWHYVSANSVRYSRLIKIELPKLETCPIYKFTEDQE